MSSFHLGGEETGEGVSNKSAVGTLEAEWNSIFRKALENAASNVLTKLSVEEESVSAAQPPKIAAKKKHKQQTTEEEEEEVEVTPVKRKAVKKPQKPIFRKKARVVVVEEEESSSSSDEDGDFEPEEKEDDDDDDDEEETLQNILGKATMMLLGAAGQADIDQVWKEGLNEEEVKRYAWIFDKLEDMQMDIPKILRSNLTDSEKERAVYVMLNFQTNSPSYEEMARLIISRKQNPIPLEKLQHYEAMERELSKATKDRVQLKFKVLDLQMKLEHKSIVWEEFEQLKNLEPGQSDYHKKFEWLQWILRLPWNKFYPTPVFQNAGMLCQAMIEFRNDLDRHVYGLPNVKEELMLFSQSRFVPHTLPGQLESAGLSHAGGRILAIEGSPGVGKTHLIKTLARCWGIPFQGIAAGGCKDSSFWKGHGRTYEGAVPGRIVQALRSMKAMNGVICIDELDKLSEHEHSKDVGGVLLHILDETQNNEFYDDYLGDVPVDLSHVLWVLLINDRNTIPPVLRDRLYIIKVPDPTVKDKLETVKTITLPEILKVSGLDASEIEFTDDAIKHIIDTKTCKEKGMRRLKQLLQAVVKRVAYLKHNLIGLPNAAVWHAAQVAAMNAIRTGTPMQGPEMPQPLTTAQKETFAKQTSFYWPEFKLPLKVTVDVLEKVLHHYKVDDLMDYREKGWII